MESVILPILIFVALAMLIPVGMLGAGSLLGPRRSGDVKEMPYESGMDPVHDARKRFDVRFYLVAIAFLVFDVELLFLYPWAVASNHTNVDKEAVADGFNSVLVFWEVMVFIVLLAAGFVYAWRKGVFQWR